MIVMTRNFILFYFFLEDFGASGCMRGFFVALLSVLSLDVC